MADHDDDVVVVASFLYFFKMKTMLMKKTEQTDT